MKFRKGSWQYVDGPYSENQMKEWGQIVNKRNAGNLASKCSWGQTAVQKIKRLVQKMSFWDAFSSKLIILQIRESQLLVILVCNYGCHF